MNTVKKYENPNDEAKDNVKPVEAAEYERVEDRIRVESSGEVPTDPNGGNIVHIVNNVPDGEGGVKTIVHGPMPRGEWAEYARKKGL
jgi:hypothetical protein